MPLSDRDYYTWIEALDRVRKRLPNEDPTENLRSALKSIDNDRLLSARVYDEETKTEFDLDHEYCR